MASPRTTTVNLNSTPYYHCVSRCVRRAFLCGNDSVSGKNFDHRKGWLEHRLRRLSSIFAIDICAYAIMSNHFHLVLRVCSERAMAWSDQEVEARYGSLFPLAKKALEGMSPKEKTERLAVWRERLMSLSWMMRSLNEWLARRANKEDGCTGRFWEGRFTSQPLLDEMGLLTCMAYVDLNPVRAGITHSLEGAEFTSIRARLKEAAGALDRHTPEGGAKRRATPTAAREAAELSRVEKKRMVPEGLAPFCDQVRKGDEESQLRDPLRAVPIPMHFVDYVELLTWSGKATREKQGVTQGALAEAPVLLERLRVNPEHFLRTMRSHGLTTSGVLGSLEHVRDHAKQHGKRWVRGVGHAKAIAA